MRLSVPICPECGSPAVGTCDLIPATALFDQPVTSTDVDVEYLGESKVDWDNQYTLVNDHCMFAVCCENGHMWNSKITDEKE